MVPDKIKQCAYDIGYKGESKEHLEEWELNEIQDILLTHENLTYTELQNLPDETAQWIIEVKKAYQKGQKRAEDEKTPKK